MRRSRRAYGESATLLDLLVATGATLATAESLTGGRLASALTAIPGASRSYLGGVVGYATTVKESVLGVSAALVEQYGVVSSECAAAMASGARAVTGATYALSTTGVAGPGEQEGKPVGTVYVGLAGPQGGTVLAMDLVGSREEICDRTVHEAIAALCAQVRQEQPGLG